MYPVYNGSLQLRGHRIPLPCAQEHCNVDKNHSPPQGLHQIQYRFYHRPYTYKHHPQSPDGSAGQSESQPKHQLYRSHKSLFYPYQPEPGLKIRPP